MTARDADEAVANANARTTYDVGMCQQFVRTSWELPAVYGSAIDAWNGARHKHPGDRHPPKGAPCFYRGGTYGHVVIAKPGSAGMRSTDCPTSGRVNDASLDWPEDAWGDDYLGWAEDLNGVDLPLGEDDDMTEDDWKRLRNIVHDEVEAAWETKMDVDKPDGSPTRKAREQVIRETLQRVQK